MDLPVGWSECCTDRGVISARQDMALNRVGNLERETMPMMSGGRNEDGQQQVGGSGKESGVPITVPRADMLPDPLSRRFIVDYFVSLCFRV